MVSLSLLLAMACQPPIEINTAPMVQIESPAEDGQTFNEGSGFSVVATVSDRDGDELTVELSSSSQGVLDTQVVSAGSQVYLSTEGLTQGVHVLVVTASDGQLTGTSQVQVEINGAPSLPQIRITPQDPDTTDDLVASLEAESVDPEGSAVEYEWYWSEVDDTQVYLDDDGQLPHVLSSKLTTRGDVWEFTIKATEAEGDDPITVQSTAQVTIGNSPPGAPVVELLPAQPHPLSSLSCTIDSESVDADDDAITYQYSWRINGEELSDQSSASLPASTTAEGDVVECTATAWDGYDLGGSGSDSVIIGSGQLSLSDASVVIRGSLAGDRVGEHAVGLMLNPTDGVDDLAVGAPDYFSGQGLVAIYQGGGLSTKDLSARRYGVTAPSGWHLGGPMIAVDDTDGDGHRDLVVAAQGGSADPRVLVIPGRSFSVPGSTSADSTSFQGTALRHVRDEPGWGVALAGGDLDSDGLADVVVTHESAKGNQLYLFTAIDMAAASGSPPSLTSVAADVISSGAPEDGFGLATSAAGDLDGDGQDDLAVSAPYGSDRTHTWVFLDPTHATRTADAELAIDHSSSAGTPGAEVLIVPDLDGDGYDELVISSPWESVSAQQVGAVAILGGDAALPSTLGLIDADLWIDGEEEDAAFGSTVIDLGDVDEDGLPDLAIGAPDAQVGAYPGAGRVWLFTGSSLPLTGGVVTTADAALVVEGEERGAGILPAGTAGDLDFDGRDDLLVGFSGYDYGGAADVGGLFVFLSGS